MSIEQFKKIDFIGINKNSEKVELGISDHLDWTDENNHLELLQKKLNTYLSFIESGEIFKSYPNSINRGILIEIIGKYNLSDKAKEFFNNAKVIVTEAGFELSFKLLENK